MKKYFELFWGVLLFSMLFRCSENIEYDSLVERNGINYKVNSEEAYSGEAFSKYENDQLSLQCAYKEGKLDGEYNEWYKNGQFKVRTTYISGTPENEYTTWYENGQVMYSCNYVNGEISGAAVEYWSNGNKKLIQGFVNGVANGEMTEYSEEGNKIKSSDYVDGLLHGKVVEYSKTGTPLFVGSYANGKGIGEHVLQDSLGHPIAITLFDSTGALMSKKYFVLDDAKTPQMYRLVKFTEGKITDEYGYSDGELIVEKIDSTLLGIDYRRYKYWVDGEIFIDNVVRSGWVEKFWDWEDGPLAKKFQVNNTGFIEDGKYYEYDENGNLWIEGSYRSGSKTGVWKWYDKYGRITNTEYY